MPISLCRIREKKEYVLFILFSALFLFFSPVDQKPAIDVVFPASEQVLKGSKFHFIYGNVQPSNAQFKINGRFVKLYKTGSFMAYLPVEKGEFVFECSAIVGNDTMKYNHFVYVDFLSEIPTDSLMIDLDSVSPKESLILVPGDELELSLRATPKSKVLFKIEGSNNWYLLKPKKRHPEFYSGKLLLTDKIQNSSTNGHVGTYEIDASDPIKNRSIKVRVENTDGDVISHSFGDITISAEPVNRFIELKEEITRIFTDHENPGDLFLPSETVLKVSSKKGPFWRVAIGQESGWIKDGTFRWLTKEDEPAMSRISKIQIEELDYLTRVRVPLSHKAPFRVEQTRNQKHLQLNIWDVQATQDIDLINPSGLIKRILWENKIENTVKLNFLLDAKQQWGYYSSYENNDLLLDIRHPPKSISGKLPLYGRSIMLDAGHHPDEGVIGPSRLEERQVNWQITKILKHLLEEDGANVILTRTDEQGMSINGRLQKINLIQPEVVISIHNNSIPEGFDPYRRRGTSTYYYHPQSYPLAKLVQNNLVREIKLPSQGVRFADLAICRPTGMPSILIEAAFMVLPKQEYLLGTEKFQTKIAKSIHKSLKQFFKKNI